MKQQLDIENWARKDHFNFFNSFEDPFFGLTVQIDCSSAYSFCKEEGISFFLHYLHKSLLTANSIEPFRYRIENDRIWIYDSVHASPTINRENGTFGFAYMDFNPRFEIFEKKAKKEIERVRNETGLVPAVSGENVIHYSSIPWIDFSAISHAQSFSFSDSCPKISFGKMSSDGTKKMLPVSIHVHHALMDGYHVGKFITKFQQLMNQD